MTKMLTKMLVVVAPVVLIAGLSFAQRDAFCSGKPYPIWTGDRSERIRFTVIFSR